jgi:phosphatidylglycerophosphate synthase
MAKISEVAKFFKRDHFNRLLVKIFYYPLAVLVSWIAVSLGIHAHIVNLLGLASTISAALIIFYLGGKWMILAGFLVAFGLVIDLSDGTVARFYNNKNAMGKWLDESSGIIGLCVVFFALMMKTFVENSDLLIIVLGTYVIFSYFMINYAALLSEVLRAKFNLTNPMENVRAKASRTLFGIPPGFFAFALDIQWTLVALGVMFNRPYELFIIFGVISTLQWMSRYIVFLGK